MSTGKTEAFAVAGGERRARSPSLLLLLSLLLCGGGLLPAGDGWVVCCAREEVAPAVRAKSSLRTTGREGGWGLEILVSAGTWWQKFRAVLVGPRDDTTVSENILSV